MVDFLYGFRTPLPKNGLKTITKNIITHKFNSKTINHLNCFLFPRKRNKKLKAHIIDECVNSHIEFGLKK